MKRINVSNKGNIMDTLEGIKNNLLVAYSSMNSLERHLSNNYIINNSIKGVLMAYYFLRKEEAKREGNKFMINPDINVYRKIWGLTETKENKKLIKLVLPSIEFRQSFYISRNEYDIINNEVINDLNEKIKDKNFQINDNIDNKDMNKKKLSDKEPKLRKKVIILENENPDSEVNHKRSKRFKSKKELKSINKEQKKINYIKVILLHNSYIRINLPLEKDSILNKFLCCSSSRYTNYDISKNSIILHIHGGGFITLSPIYHENYLRKIVNKTGIASLSVNYRFSPEYSFPSALDDIYQIYTWLIENGENDLNLKIKNIILLGDSAGGNLILSLVYILLIRGIKLPNLIILAYLAVKMNIIPLSLSYIII
jgi:hormone-sensitive lipase